MSGTKILYGRYHHSECFYQRTRCPVQTYGMVLPIPGTDVHCAATRWGEIEQRLDPDLEIRSQ
eukprot:2255041-Rhodomonas_salina.1